MQGKFQQLIQRTQYLTLIRIKLMQEENWKYVNEFIHLTLKTVQQQLDKESIDSVYHYLDHDEFEMAFEGLFLEIMRLERIPEIDLLKSKQVGKLLKLNEESVFDYNFWEKFDNYVKGNIQSSG